MSRMNLKRTPQRGPRDPITIKKYFLRNSVIIEMRLTRIHKLLALCYSKFMVTIRAYLLAIVTLCCTMANIGQEICIKSREASQGSRRRGRGQILHIA